MQELNHHPKGEIETKSSCAVLGCLGLLNGFGHLFAVSAPTF